MIFTEKKQKLDYLLYLIKNEGDASAIKLSERICVSKRTLYRCIVDLRELGHNIGYCSVRRSYYLISAPPSFIHNDNENFGLTI